MTLRDKIETTLRSWNAHEIDRGAPPVVDYDCAPPQEPATPATSRLAVRAQLSDLLSQAETAGQDQHSERLRASLAYLDHLLGARPELGAYIHTTQGCAANGWPADYVTAIGRTARERVEALGVAWGPNTADDLEAKEGPLDTEAAPEAIRAAAAELEPAVRALVGSDAPFELTIEQVNLDAYWAYWLDGAGPRVRMRINDRNARFTAVQARQFALHEILGHGLQCASYAQRCATEDVPWVRLTAVHAPQQVLLEGLAQALPLFITLNDEWLTTRVRLAHYLELVRAELHLAINAGTGPDQCAAHARERIPFWTDARLSDLLTDRGADPLLRSYLWSYPAGIDWFTHLADDAPAETTAVVLQAAYRDPLTPDELATLWPGGPAVGGPSQPTSDPRPTSDLPPGGLRHEPAPAMHGHDQSGHL